MDDERTRARRLEPPTDWAGGGYVSEPTPEEIAEQRRRDAERLEAEALARAEQARLAARKTERDSRWKRHAPRSGVMLGRFLPVHHGHLHLLEVARAMSPELLVLVSAAPDDPIEGALRVEWLRELAPTVRVELATGLPTGARGSADPTWLDAAEDLVLQHCAARPQALYGAEPAHAQLAARLEVPHRAVDPQREGVPVSGTLVRSGPLEQWQHLPPPVRAHLVRRVAVVGPEGVGKTALTKALAVRFRTVWVPEVARAAAAARGGYLDQPTFEYAVAAQRASEASLARKANGVLFCDSNALAMEHMMARLWKKAPPWVAEHGRDDAYDLTLVLSGKLPFFGDATRDDEFARGLYTKKLTQTLAQRGTAHAVLADVDATAREQAAALAVQTMLDATKFLPARALAKKP